MRVDKSWQALDETAFDLSKFSIDWENESVTCPNGHSSRDWKPAKVQFDKFDCATCAIRAQCPRSRNGPRAVTLHPKPQHLALQSARERQDTKEWKQTYATRAGVEGTVSQAVFAKDMQRTRYRGLNQTHLQHVATAVAINLQRFVSGLLGAPRSQTRISRFAALAASLISEERTVSQADLAVTMNKTHNKKDIEALRKRIYDFVIRIVTRVKELPKTRIGNRIGGQLLDAGPSVGANFEEAIAAFSPADFPHKVSVAKKEADETNFGLRVIRDTDLLPKHRMTDIIAESAEIKPILTSAVKTAQETPEWR